MPEKGFYYHFKHDPKISVHNYAYEYVGIGEHTEDREQRFVIYRPLSPDSPAYKEGKLFYVRPAEMFLENVTRDGKTFPRFSKITDPNVIAELERYRKEMYD